MHQVKLFKGVESELGHLESEINAWLGESGARVVNMFGNIAPQTMKPEGSAGASARMHPPSDLFVAVLYLSGEGETA